MLKKSLDSPLQSRGFQLPPTISSQKQLETATFSPKSQNSYLEKFKHYRANSDVLKGQRNLDSDAYKDLSGLYGSPKNNYGSPSTVLGSAALAKRARYSTQALEDYQNS